MVDIRDKLWLHFERLIFESWRQKLGFLQATKALYVGLITQDRKSGGVLLLWLKTFGFQSLAFLCILFSQNSDKCMVWGMVLIIFLDNSVRLFESVFSTLLSLCIFCFGLGSLSFGNRFLGLSGFWQRWSLLFFHILKVFVVNFKISK